MSKAVKTSLEQNLTMINVKVVLLTKDEYDLIDDFIEYYSYLFGVKNIVIVDNGSTDPRVLATYAKLLPEGLTVIQDASPFHNASVFMTNHIHTIISTNPETEWIMCLETDEFLFQPANLHGVIDPNAIHEYLASIPKDVTYLRYKNFWGSVVDPSKLTGSYVNGQVIQPVHNITEFHDQNWDKPLVRANAFVSITQWLHHAQIEHGRAIVCNELGLLHFHNTGKRRLFERARNVLESIGVFEANESIMNAWNKSRIFFQKRASHAHKAEYAADVYLRIIAWELAKARFGATPSLDVINRAVRGQSIQAVLDILEHWDKNDANTHTFEQCVYPDEPVPVEFYVTSVAKTMKYISSQAESIV